MTVDDHRQTVPANGPRSDAHATLPARASRRLSMDLWVMLALELCWCFFQLFHSPLIAHGDGYGYDGTFYGNLAQNFDWSAIYRQLDSYRLQRVLPSVAIGSLLNLLSIHTVSATVLSFRLLALVELTVAVIGWSMIAGRLGFDRVRTWLGFTLMFLNFPFVTNAFYYPVLTDTTAFMLGVWIVYAYVSGRVGLLVGLGLVGAFCWPVCAPACALLLLFPLRWREGNPPPWSRLVLALCGLGAAGLVGLGILLRVSWKIRQVTGGTVLMNDLLLPVSALIQFSLLALGAMLLFGRLSPRRLWTAVRAIPLLGWLCALMVLIVPRIIILLIKKNVPPLLPMKLYLAVLAFTPMSRPAATLVGQFAYFGFVVPLLVLNWRRITSLVDRGGLGMIGFVALSMLVALSPEARQALLGFPAFVVMLCCIASHRWTARQVWVLGILQLLLARPWIDQNSAARLDLLPPDDLPTYFASQGTFMSGKAYLVFLVLLLLATGICYLQRRGSRLDSRRIDPGPDQVF